MPVDPVKVGYVRRAHGIRGAAIVRVLSDEFDQFAAGRVLATDHTEYPMLTVMSANPHKDGLLTTFAEITDRNLAEGLRGTSFFVPSEQRRTLEEDEFWPEDLIGLDVMKESGDLLGEVVGLISGDAQDRLVVATSHGEVEVPFVAEIVTSVDTTHRRVVLDPPEGLFEL